ncbi:hypothetical protein KTR66_03210 [Roseococcus sp. SDR]|uniref:hypothetical protein n=1 Tax=Roseococcus sp. SDR TaxID=2835532 RepID=UPI001BD12A09|nr:hypothetical protein [Roseococcus sp. SDR]MBS7788986.1 hypothetical protein [Roseococcus sp. SDR]MBV1844300.1 hypothetical protein [Roseococcus sp. SDR]
MRRLLLLALPMLLPAGALAQLPGVERDCAALGLAPPRFASVALGDGSYIYRMDLADHGRTGIRYSYSFTLPGSSRPAEALNGYLPPGGRIEHALGTSDRNLDARALQAATTLRCFAP